jgi:hypothetical protein
MAGDSHRGSNPTPSAPTSAATALTCLNELLPRTCPEHCSVIDMRWWTAVHPTIHPTADGRRFRSTARVTPGPDRPRPRTAISVIADEHTGDAPEDATGSASALCSLVGVIALGACATTHAVGVDGIRPSVAPRTAGPDDVRPADPVAEGCATQTNRRGGVMSPDIPTPADTTAPQNPRLRQDDLLPVALASIGSGCVTPTPSAR